MATGNTTQLSRAGQPLLPPDERFWKRYSPHFELPVAGATALFAHGVIIGILAVGGLAFLFRASAEMSRPSTIDMVAVDPDAAFPGPLGAAPEGMPGLPGELGADRTEQGPEGGVAGNVSQPNGGDPLPDLPELPGMSLEVPATVPQTDASSEVGEQLQAINKAAAERSKVAPPAPKRPASAGPARKSGTGNKWGGGGMGGTGGKGVGKSGTGTGGGAASYRASDAEIKAYRWQFDLSGPPREHADKLDRAGVIVALPDPKAGHMDPRTAPLLLITDVKRRPVTLKPAAPGQFRDFVKWYNTRPESIQGLAQELQLPFMPPCVVLLMPKDREAKMADAEMRYAQEHRIDFARIQRTTFDFRLRNGVYEPVVLNQQ
jgi:hypothetical protein